MKELSLNILDIVQNSIKADAKNICISLDEQSGGILNLRISDDGKGMNSEVLQVVSDPFYTTRTTRKVGLGIPFIKLAAEQTGGSFKIESSPGEGTILTATFDTKHIDCIPIGDMTQTMTTLIMGAPDTDFELTHTCQLDCVKLSTRQLRELLDGAPLCDTDVILWIKKYLTEQYINFKGVK